jgi:hypothetical protein
MRRVRGKVLSVLDHANLSLNLVVTMCRDIWLAGRMCSPAHDSKGLQYKGRQPVGGIQDCSDTRNQLSFFETQYKYRYSYMYD